MSIREREIERLKRMKAEDLTSSIGGLGLNRHRDMVSAKWRFIPQHGLSEVIEACQCAADTTNYLATKPVIGASGQ